MFNRLLGYVKLFILLEDRQVHLRQKRIELICNRQSGVYDKKHVAVNIKTGICQGVFRHDE